MDQKTAVKKNNKIWLDCIFIAVLFVFPFIHLAFGVDFTDTGYSLGNFENLENMNITWTIATFWANIVGKFFTMLPLGHTWIGMKLYTTLIPAAGAIISYVFLKKYIPKGIVFVGEIITLCLCWCPTTILYNYLTYFLFLLAIVVLIKSLEKDSYVGLLIAGIILAFNVFVRFPNITEVSLILVVWLDGFVKKKKISKVILTTLVCIGGFILGIAINVLIIGIQYGVSSIPAMVQSLFSMTGEEAGYTPKAMVFKMFTSYYTYRKSYIFMIGILTVAFVLGVISRKHWLKILACVVQAGLYVLFVVWAIRNKVFTLNYEDYSSVYFWGIIILMLCNIFSIVTILRKNTSDTEKMIAMASLIVIWITPLGSNNGLFPAYNNLFIVAPATIYMIWRELFKGRNFYELMDMETKNSMIAFRIMVALLMLCITIQSLIFGFVFIFRDAGFPYKNHYSIDGNEVLAGMHTNEERALVIEELTEYAKENNYSEKKAVFYGDLPALEYILKMPCAISHTWPNLGSFSFEEFETDLDNLTDTPVIFINENVCEDIFDLSETATKKECALSEYMVNNNYILVEKIDNIAIYESR